LIDVNTEIIQANNAAEAWIGVAQRQEILIYPVVELLVIVEAFLDARA
jgi:PAS domain-containing protein